MHNKTITVCTRIHEMQQKI